MSAMPVPQFEPTTSAPAAASPAAACSTLTPMTVKKPRGVRSKVIVAITGSAGATRLAARTARVASAQVGHRLDAQDVRAGFREHCDLLLERRLDGLGGRVAEGLQQLTGRADRGRDERAPGDRAPNRLHCLPVDARARAVEAVQLQAERAAAEGVGRDQVGPGLEVEARHLLDHVGTLEREPLRRLPGGQAAQHELSAPRPVADQQLAPRRAVRAARPSQATPSRALTRSTACAASQA